MATKKRTARSGHLPVRLSLLGPIKIEREGRTVAPARRKAEALLAYLALYPQEHPREHLAALFWGDSTDDAARVSLRVALNLLRNEIAPDLLLAERATVALNPQFPLWLDARELRDAARGGDPERRLAAVELYRGELLEGFYDEWVLRARDEYRALYLETLLEIVRELRTAGEYARAISYARRVLATERANEPAHQHLIFCLWMSGDRNAALAQYEECKRALADELGVEPSRETAELAQRVKTSAPPGPSPLPQLTNLPTPLTSFIGRELVLEKLEPLLQATRLLTLTGPGGCGKTRLAIELAHRALPAFRDGVWWIELGALQDPLRVPEAVLRALGVEATAGQDALQALIGSMRSRHLLLVMDNCEHLIDACAQLAEMLLTQCAGVQILATSREALSLPGEVAWLVPTLSAPQLDPGVLLSPQELGQYESVRLFMERARAARPDFALTPDNARAVSEICAQLDGIPLALELAAARLRAMSVRDIAARLDDRFHVLSYGTRTALPRQQTLRNLLDWSYQLLSEPEQALFQRLGVFVGGFDLQALEAVCGYEPLARRETADLLARLVDKSLVSPAVTDRSRYALLETLRAYALEQLCAGEGERVVRERHAKYFTALAAQVDAAYGTAHEVEWALRMEPEYSNLSAALEWALENGQAEAALRAIVQLWVFWFHRSYYTEGSLWVARALNAPVEEPLLRLEGLQLAAALGRQQGDHARTAAFLEAGQKIAAGMDEKGPAGARLGSFYKELGTFARDRGEYADAIRYLEQSWQILRELDKFEMIESLLFLADVHMRRGDLSRSRPLWEEAVARCRALKYEWYLGWSLGGLGEQARFEGNFEQALVHLKASIELKLQTRDMTGIAFTLETMGNTAAQQGEAERAAVLWGAAERLREDIHAAVPGSYQEDYDLHIAHAREQLGAGKFAGAWQKGRALTFDEVMEYALERQALA